MSKRVQKQIKKAMEGAYSKELPMPDKELPMRDKELPMQDKVLHPDGTVTYEWPDTDEDEADT